MTILANDISTFISLAARDENKNATIFRYQESGLPRTFSVDHTPQDRAEVSLLLCGPNYSVTYTRSSKPSEPKDNFTMVLAAIEQSGLTFINVKCLDQAAQGTYISL